MGLLALPAMWAGRDGKTILQITIEAAERIVPIRFAMAGIDLLPDTPRYCLLRLDGRNVEEPERIAWEAAAAQWEQTRLPDGRIHELATPLQPMRVVRLSMGYGNFGGNIWFGSDREDFPTTSQLAFLRAAASLATTGVQTARADFEREQASRAKDEFLAMLGHELRNPLAPIITVLDLVKLRSKGQPLPREHEIIERQAKHLSRLLDDLLDVTRIIRGKVELKREPLDLTNLLERAIEAASALFHERGHTLTTRLPEQAVWVFGDPTRLMQVFANLLSNAAKYTDRGGCIEVTLETSGQQVTISVRDNGSGISPVLFPKLFKIFEQGSATIDRAKGGLGIGLALVKSFVELHEGSVTASSAGIGCGSTFRVSLPLLNQPAIITHASDAVPGLRHAAVRVLVVDDNIDALESLRDYLAHQGHDVRTASEPLQALQLAEQFHPDVAVLDIGLPGMDGYALAKALRASFPPERLRLVALTGYGQTKDFERSKQAGFETHLVKPVALEALDAAVNAPAAPNGDPNNRHR
ncbi:hybrid sensor histidine kinase/response regulator [Stutzerimonas azotifigens]|nr:ATP-binding protein [Stutzerimonas azotifigens]